jgi:hypothetical protein
MSSRLLEEVMHLEKLVIDARANGIDLRQDYYSLSFSRLTIESERQGYSFQESIETNSRRLILFGWSHTSDPSQEEFERSIDVLLDAANLMRGTCWGDNAEKRARLLVREASNFGEQPLVVPERFQEYDGI